MSGFVARQPNGLLCRFSSVVDTVTDWNMTDEEYIELCAERGRQTARDVLQNHIQPFNMVKERFVPHNNTRREFKQLVEEMSKSVTKKT